MSNAPYTGRLDGRVKLRLVRLAHAFDGMVLAVSHMEWTAAQDEPAAQAALLLGGLTRLLVRAADAYMCVPCKPCTFLLHACTLRNLLL